MKRIAVIGASGRMGQMIVSAIQAADGATLGAATEVATSPAIGQDAGVLAGIGSTGVIVSADSEALFEADALIDFSTAEATAAMAPRAAAHGIALVVGTTGLEPAQADTLREAATRIPLVWAPNMSVGVNVLFKLAGEAARLLGPDYSLEIVESHHRHKKDAPSGTALHLAQILADATPEQGPLQERLCHGREGLRVRSAHEIGVHAIRGGDIAGEHTVMYCGDGERLELTIRASSRQTYAQGAVRAALWAAGQKPGLYDMHDVLGLRSK
jgi:4-hydroxy-tetrahydrodipicolinate reductase